MVQFLVGELRVYLEVLEVRTEADILQWHVRHVARREDELPELREALQARQASRGVKVIHVYTVNRQAAQGSE